MIGNDVVRCREGPVTATPWRRLSQDRRVFQAGGKRHASFWGSPTQEGQTCLALRPQQVGAGASEDCRGLNRRSPRQGPPHPAVWCLSSIKRLTFAPGHSPAVEGSGHDCEMNVRPQFSWPGPERFSTSPQTLLTGHHSTVRRPPQPRRTPNGIVPAPWWQGGSARPIHYYFAREFGGPVWRQPFRERRQASAITAAPLFLRERAPPRPFALQSSNTLALTCSWGTASSRSVSGSIKTVGSRKALELLPEKRLEYSSGRVVSRSYCDPSHLASKVRLALIPFFFFDRGPTRNSTNAIASRKVGMTASEPLPSHDQRPCAFHSSTRPVLGFLASSRHTATASPPTAWCFRYRR